LFNHVLTWLLLTIVSSWGCSGPADDQDAGSPATPAPAAISKEEAPLPPLEYESALPESIRSLIDRPFTGDLDEMVKRRMIRVGVTSNRTHYFVDNGIQRGATYEYLKMFEDTLNKELQTGNLEVLVIFVPLRRDLLLPALVDGKVDVVPASLTATAERRAVVDFSDPTVRNVNEVVVTGPGAPTIATLDDLSGQEVFARSSSSYYQSLLALNSRFQSRGLKPVAIHDTPEHLEDEDLLEMVNAGLIKIVVVDDYLAAFWAKVFPHLVVHDDVALRTGGHLAVAFRKNSPKLAAEANDFIAKFGLNRAFGNVMKKRYLESTSFVKSATAGDDRRKFESLVALFRKYGTQYDVDYLLMVAKGYQESGLNQNRRSPVGAIGVMQVMPATGRAMNVGDITRVEPNIHAGVKYFRLMMDEYFKSDPMDDLNKVLFTHASYNAGPGRIRQLRREAARRNLDRNVWFDNTEEIVSERIGRETVGYVSNI
jgi:membrane-bound lytic murein transglycosylase MltF